MPADNGGEEGAADEDDGDLSELSEAIRLCSKEFLDDQRRHALGRLAASAHDIRVEAASLQARTSEAEAAEGRAAEAVEELRKERHQLLRFCEQIFGLVVGFSGFPRTGSAQASLRRLASNTGAAASWDACSSSSPSRPSRGAALKALADGHVGDAEQLLQDQVVFVEQARDQAQRSLDSAERALRDAEDYLEWVRGDVELLRREVDDRSTRLTLHVGGASHTLRARQERSVMSPMAFEYSVRIGDERVVQCESLTAEGANRTWPARGFSEGVGSMVSFADELPAGVAGLLPCELRAVAPGTTSVTVHKRRLLASTRQNSKGSMFGRGPTEEKWSLPENSIIVSVEALPETPAQAPPREITRDLERTFTPAGSPMCTVGISSSPTPLGESDTFCMTPLYPPGTGFDQSMGQASEVCMDRSCLSLTGVMTRTERCLYDPCRSANDTGEFNTFGDDPLDRSVDPVVGRGRGNSTSDVLALLERESTSGFLGNVLLEETNRNAQFAQSLSFGQSLQVTAQTPLFVSQSVDEDCDEAGLAEVAAQFRCVMGGTGFIRRGDLARLLKALERVEGEWTDARVDRLLGVTTTDNGAQIPYEAFLGWIFGPPGTPPPGSEHASLTVTATSEGRQLSLVA